jgi:hypothetical protein
LRDTRKELYLSCTKTSNNAEWEKGWFYLRNDGAGLPPYTGKMLREKPDAWVYGVSPPSRQSGGFRARGNVHHRQLPPPAGHPPHGEELRIFEMSDAANLVLLARSRLLQERLPKGNVATRARHAINLKTVLHSDDDLWSFDAP